VWSASRPGRLYPRERPGTHCTVGWVGSGAGLERCGNSRPTGIRSPGLPACSESLYRLRYPGSRHHWEKNKIIYANWSFIKKTIVYYSTPTRYGGVSTPTWQPSFQHFCTYAVNFETLAIPHAMRPFYTGHVC
jgi:hypothetical protein